MIFEFYLLIFIEGCNLLWLLFDFNIQLENIAFITTLRIRFFFFFFGCQSENMLVSDV